MRKANPDKLKFELVWKAQRLDAVIVVARMDRVVGDRTEIRAGIDGIPGEGEKRGEGTHMRCCVCPMAATSLASTSDLNRSAASSAAGNFSIAAGH
jgi:hypothetical protein